MGNIGSPQRLEYTLIGDTVNLTSKLCGVAQGDEILITDAVRAELPAELPLVERPDIVPVRRVGGELRIWSVAP